MNDIALRVTRTLFLLAWALWFVWKASRDGRNFWKSPFFPAALMILLACGVVLGMGT